MPVRGKIHQDSHRITSTVRHAATPHLKTHGTTVIRLPLVYKRRRWSPSHGGRRIVHSFTLPPSLTILALASIRSQGPGGFSSSPLACIPPLRAPRCPVIQHRERTPAGRTTHGRNQDKPCVSVLLSTGHRETDLSASAS
jgi:hypothetical protein